MIEDGSPDRFPDFGAIDMIDFHTHPLLVREMHQRHPDLARIAKEVFDIGNNPQPLKTFLLELDVSGLDRAAILPIDASTTRGCKIFSNEQIAELCGMSERFIGFASVDPHNPAAVDEFEHAVKNLGLRGLKLSPATQEFFPDKEERVFEICAKAQSLGVPVIFHTGMTWAPKGKMQYGHPMRLEEIAFKFPKLNIVAAHLAWPWVVEAVALALKYPNVHLDTAALYFGNPKEFIQFAMTRQVPLSVFEKSLRNQLVFGSNYPRVEIKNMAKAVRESGLSEGALKLVFETNPKRLIGEV